MIFNICAVIILFLSSVESEMSQRLGGPELSNHFFAPRASPVFMDIMQQIFQQIVKHDWNGILLEFFIENGRIGRWYNAQTAKRAVG